MTNKDFAIAVNRFFFYSMNYPSVEIEYPTLFNGMQKRYLPDFFRAFDINMVEHFVGKWNNAYKSTGSYGAMSAFYGDLDGENRAKILKYISENYKQRDDFGINLTEIE